MHSGALDVLHHAGDDDSVAVADRVDLDFDAEQVLVHQHGAARHRADGPRHVAVPPMGCGMPMSFSASANARRSSARSIASTLEPRMSMPFSDSGCARLMAVWPPNCTSAPVTRSAAAT